MWSGGNYDKQTFRAIHQNQCETVFSDQGQLLLLFDLWSKICAQGRVKTAFLIISSMATSMRETVTASSPEVKMMAKKESMEVSSESHLKSSASGRKLSHKRVPLMLSWSTEESPAAQENQPGDQTGSRRLALVRLCQGWWHLFASLWVRSFMRPWKSDPRPLIN